MLSACKISVSRHQSMCYCALKRWRFIHTCDLISYSLILYPIRVREFVRKYLLQLYIVRCANYWLFWLGCVYYCRIVLCIELRASFSDLHFDLVWTEKLSVIYPEVTLCGWRDVKMSSTCATVQSWYVGWKASGAEIYRCCKTDKEDLWSSLHHWLVINKTDCKVQQIWESIFKKINEAAAVRKNTRQWK